MDVSDIRVVMKQYGKAWKKQDTSLLLKCFTKNGVYQESPLAQPYKGHKEIKAFWDTVVCTQTRAITFTLGRCTVSADGRGFAEWECTNTHKGKRCRMAGIMVLKMSGGKITHLNEYWNTKS